MNDGPYTYGPQFSHKPGSQGTLFRVDRSQMTAKARWPRGYTPERQAEVSKELPPARIFENKDDPLTPHGINAHSLRAHLHAAIKRSSIPVQHLKNIMGISISANDPSDPAGTSLGLYLRGRGGEGIISLTPRPAMTESVFGYTEQPSATPTNPVVHRSLIHELGHHNDPNLEINHAADGYFSARSVTQEGAGRNEAAAENYSEEHFVRDPREPNNLSPAPKGSGVLFRPTFANYDVDAYAREPGTRRKSEAFTTAYKQARNDPPADADFFDARVPHKDPDDGPEQLKLF